MKKNRWISLVCVLFFAIFANFSTQIDLFISSSLYQYNKGWDNTFLPSWIDTWGHLLPLFLCLGAALFWIVSFFSKKISFYRPFLFYIASCLALNFLLTYGIIKPLFSRPRPKNITLFSGTKPFQPFYKIGKPTNDKSFPSGHAATASYFCTLFFVGRRIRKPWLSCIGIALSIILTIVYSYTRIVLGEHFFSDTLFGAASMWLVAFWADQIICKPRCSRCH